MSYFTDFNSRVQNVMRNFDKNHDGKIGYPAKPGAGGVDERRYTSIQEDAPDAKGRVKVREMKFDIDRLVLSADQDKDGLATADEMKAVMAKYDKDGDGNLPERGLVEFLTFKPKKEGDRYNDAMGLRVDTKTYWKK